ncbi:putative integral membrane protein PTH11 [Rosellinia necatrix]|uniref:Putative integral membrane protein PTH11 n=1 Tax=Rosellinia necatrix TaxID=77044 RepID=A0A1W2TBR3_ROSNE|nr:putative integral membrane protein PTH11 [Rosellinia necatrix]
MDEAGRRVMLAQPALDTPNDAEPNLVNPPNMNALADGVAIAALTIATLAVLARIHFWVFVLKQPKGRLEAVLVIIGFASYIGFVYSLLRISQFEVGWWVHQWDMTVGDRIGFSYWVYIAGLLYNSAMAPVKAAILLEWMRIFPSSSRSAFFWLCQGALWFNVAYYTAAIIVESMRCTPRERIWDSTVNGKCLNARVDEAIFSINVGSNIVMLVMAQFIVWRLKLSIARKIGVALISTIGLFGTISAILRLVATVEHSGSGDRTYSVSPVCFWALSEMTSIFVVYGLPAIPTAFAGATAAGFPLCCPRWARELSTGRIGDSPNTRNTGLWRESRTGPSKSYKNLDRNSLPANALDTATTHCTSTTMDAGPPRPPESVCVVVKTVEIRRDEIRTGAPGDIDKGIGDGVLLRQHPWVKLG